MAKAKTPLALPTTFHPLDPVIDDAWFTPEGWPDDDGNPPPVPSTVNAFCPTGDGGGVDPTCSPGGKSQGATALPHAVNKPNQSLPDSTRPSLAKSEAAAVAQYTGIMTGHYGRINGALRDNAPVPKESAKVHAELQKAFAKVEPFDAPVTAYRGLALSSEEAKGFLGRLREHAASGTPVALAGYQSTSTSKATASRFTERAGQTGHAVDLRIAARRGLDARPYSDSEGEDELLLNHNERYRVKHVTTNRTGRRHVVELEQLL